jgi:diguanylate cyclase (GGDEF)-like protein
VAVAQRMRQALREGDTVARIGGDEFVVVLQELPDPQAYQPLLERLKEAANQPVVTDGVVLQVSASLGVTFYPQAEAISAEQLFRQADYAMYQAKMSGKNRHQIFEPKQALPDAP